MSTGRRKRLLFGFFFLIFGFFCVWFTQLYPLVVYDTDDWYFLGSVRSAAPLWGIWNPGKVFPEIAFPFFSSLGRYLVMPLTGDYMDAMTITHAIVVSAFLTGYFWCFAGMLRRALSLPWGVTVGLTAVFALFHFWIFQSGDTDNTYLFYCSDLNCYYNYLIPTLVNASLIMLQVGNPAWNAFLRKASPTAVGCLLAGLYLAVFSNLASVGILAAFAGSHLLVAVCTEARRRPLGELLRENSLYLGILLLWGLCAVFEWNGGRAEVSESAFSWGNVSAAFTGYWQMLMGGSRFFRLCVILFLLAALGAALLHRGRGLTSGGRTILIWLIAGVVSQIYTVVLCAAVEPGYIYRSEYLFPPMFFLLMVPMFSLGYLMQQYPKTAVVLPLYILLLASEVNMPGKTYREPNMSDYDGELCAEIGRDLIEQIQQADEQGLTEMTLYVPQHVSDPETEDNWPHNFRDAQYIANTLYEHGMTRNLITLNVEASAEVNRRHNLPIPEGAS